MFEAAGISKSMLDIGYLKINVGPLGRIDVTSKSFRYESTLSKSIRLKLCQVVVRWTGVVL